MNNIQYNKLSQEELIEIIHELQKEKTILVECIVGVRNLCNDYVYPKEYVLERIKYLSNVYDLYNKKFRK